MAFPGDELSSRPVRSSFIGAGTLGVYEREVDYEDGPIAEQDPSQGMSYQYWKAYIDGATVWLESEGGVKRVLYVGVGEITDISIAFNQNADLHYVYVEDNVAKMYWYNTLTSQFEVMDLPEGVRTPKITLDEKRQTQTGASDIILSYIGADHALYFRKQRDRFAVEYLLHPGPFVQLRQVYMNDGWRLQWLLVPGIPIL